MTIFFLIDTLSNLYTVNIDYSGYLYIVKFTHKKQPLLFSRLLFAFYILRGLKNV